MRKLVHRRLAELLRVSHVAGDPARQLHENERISVDVGAGGDIADLVGRKRRKHCGGLLRVGSVASYGNQRLADESRCDEQRTAAHQRIAAINAFPFSTFELHRSLPVSTSPYVP